MNIEDMNYQDMIEQGKVYVMLVDGFGNEQLYVSRETRCKVVHF